MKKAIFILLFISSSMYASNIEYVSGNISYSYVNGDCSFAKFEIIINIFTKQNTPGDSIFIYFGDGTHGYIQRVISPDMIGNQIAHNIYKTTHIYSCGMYNIYYEDTVNIPNAINTSQNTQSKFFLSANIILNPFYPFNDSYVQYNSPALKISKGQPFYINTITSTNNTFDYDSITHVLVSSNMFNYGIYVPSGVKINRTSGEIQWLNPDTIGLYSFIVNTKIFKYGHNIGSTVHYYKFEVVNQNLSYIYDSINSIPVNTNNFKEITYTAGNTYSFSAVYTDLSADSIKLIAHPIDFFTTNPVISITASNPLKNILSFSWSPLAADERLFPYNFVLQSISYYPNDSVSNSYHTVSFISGLFNGINEKVSGSEQIITFPNPTNSILNITDETNQLQNATIEMKNPLGQTVFVSPFSNQIDISSLASGMYFLTVQDRGIKKTVKVVKE
ncbi:MAG: T9SS type A sorting domain-containing protein [Bacteroidota bacterium]